MICYHLQENLVIMASSLTIVEKFDVIQEICIPPKKSEESFDELGLI